MENRRFRIRNESVEKLEIRKTEYSLNNELELRFRENIKNKEDEK